uniref:Uncharacterized protein n=1 Tax=Arundo donax TaxID=35708 RepID=A0A0A9FFN0_ARUDO
METYKPVMLIGWVAVQRVSSGVCCRMETYKPVMLIGWVAVQSY